VCFHENSMNLVNRGPQSHIGLLKNSVSFRGSETLIYMHVPEDPAVVGAVGRIALRHGQLDYILRMTIKTLGGLSIQDALDATARLGSRELRERIRKLARQRLGEGAPLLRLEAILQRAAKRSFPLSAPSSD
jgi:hypothetical protein